MLTINLAFKFRNLDFKFEATVRRGEVHNFEKQYPDLFEPALRDKLFWVLCGLDRGYTGKIEGEGLCFNASSFNNVLAIGDRSMFVRGSVRRNIYKALRLRADRKTAQKRTDEVIELYNLKKLENLNVKLLEDGELVTVALARAHFRRIGLVIYKGALEYVEILLQKYKDAYIIVV